MNEAVIRINNIPIYGFGILAVFSFLWGSYVFYKKALESNFEEKHVLDSIVLAAFWSFIVGRLMYVIFNIEIFWNHFTRVLLLTNYPGLDRWGVMVGIIIGFWLCIRKLKFKFMDWLDLVALGVSAGNAIFFAGLSIMAFMWQLIVISMLFLLVFIYFWRVEDKYRNFGWYRNSKTSARSGFIAGFSISYWGLLFIIERILTQRFNWQVGFWGGTLFVGGLILVYIRSGRSAKEDIKIIFKHGKK